MGHIPSGTTAQLELLIADLFHIIRRGCPLGIDVEHDKGVKAVAQGDALNGFQGIVQRIRLGGGGVDADADERILSPGAEDIPVLRVKIGGIEPLFDIVLVGAPTSSAAPSMPTALRARW